MLILAIGSSFLTFSGYGYENEDPLFIDGIKRSLYLIG